MYGTKITSIRLARGYTQEYVAKQIGMDQQSYSKIEKDNKVKVSDELLSKIAEVLGVSIEDIKSPTPIIMNFHNSPYSGQYNSNNTNTDAQLIEALRNELQEKNEQLKEKDEQIKALIAKLK